MITKKNRPDSEIYILGSEAQKKKDKTTAKNKWIAFCICLAIIILTVIFVIFSSKEQTPEYYFEPEETLQSISITTVNNENPTQKGYIETQEETINNVPLLIYIPHKATMSLSLGVPDKSDSTIIFTAMAADIRKDNKKIVGDFVLSGKQLSRGIAKKGFCAVIDQTISIGMGEDTPLLQQAIENNGFFFRQYPLVHNSQLIENKPKNKSIRRALAVRNEQVIMVESKNIESFHDFSQALIDIGVSDAIYLVGGDAYGWYYTKELVRQEFGKEKPDFPENTSFIVWRTR
jgi:hypothetical protein